MFRGRQGAGKGLGRAGSAGGLMGFFRGNFKDELRDYVSYDFYWPLFFIIVLLINTVSIFQMLFDIINLVLIFCYQYFCSISNNLRIVSIISRFVRTLIRRMMKYRRNF